MKKLLLIILTALPLAAQGQQRIGAAGGVSGLVKAAAPGAAAREIKSGSPVFLNDRVTTGPKARLQVMLLDETVFTVGPNSDMTLDEFVYDPSNDAGKVSAKVTKGVFRFVTGKVARKEPDNMKVKLPVGTIGIRGTMFFVGVSDGSTDVAVLEGTVVATTYQPVEQQPSGPTPARELVVLLGPGAGNNANETPGAISVHRDEQSVFIEQPGFGVNIVPGQNLIVMDLSSQIQQLTAELSPEPGQGGGEQGGQQGGREQGGNSQQEPEQAAEPVNETAGQNTAAAGATLSDTALLGEVTQTLQDTSNTASNDIITEPPPAPVSGISTWDQVRSIESGVVLYRGTGLAALVGSAAGNYDLSFKMQVDFGGKIYGGGASQIEILPIGSMTPWDSSGIAPTDFSSLALSGPAAILLKNNLGNLSNPSFDNSVVTFYNSGNTVADHLTLSMVYNGPVSNGAGLVTTGPAEIVPQ